jgi:iron complex transport system substrate-binding protein
VKGNGITMAFSRFIVPTLPLVLLTAAGCASPAAAPLTPSTAPTETTSDAPSPDPTPSEGPFPVTLTDALGNELTLDAAPERIVSLAPSNTEIVCALDACDRLVGVTDFDDYPPEVADVDDVVISAQVDVELVVEAEPDLVLAAGNELTPTAVLQQLDDLGLPVLVLYPESMEEVLDDIRLLGSALGREVEAATLAEEMEGRIADVAAAVDGADAPSTLYEVFHSEGVTYTAGEGSFLASLIEIAGGDPVTGDAQGVLPPEQLVAADPELILLGSASYDPALADPASALSAVAGRPGWSEITAVREGAVVPYLDDIVTTRPGPRIVDGLEALARAIHPERFD